MASINTSDDLIQAIREKPDFRATAEGQQTAICDLQVTIRDQWLT